MKIKLIAGEYHTAGLDIKAGEIVEVSEEKGKQLLTDFPHLFVKTDGLEGVRIVEKIPEEPKVEEAEKKRRGRKRKNLT